LQHSISNAYIEAIENSQYFIYIENQFFITATGEEQSPIRNKIGGAIVERVIKAAKAGEKYKVVVAIPAIPGL
jgi:phospholipase D1/2